MRTIMNISLPKETALEIKREVKSGGYASTSEFLRAVLRERKENAILLDVEESRREFLSGKAKVLRSLKDLR